MGENEKPELQKVVISLDDSDETKKRECEEEENADRKATYVYTSKAEEYKMLADLTDFPNVAAMLAGDATLRESRKKRKKKKQKIESQLQNGTKPDEMGENEKPELQKVVISLDDSDDEGAKNDRSCEISETKKRKCEEEENADRKATYVYKSKAEEYKMLADLTDFPNVAAMLAADNTLRESKKKRKKKKQKIESQLQNGTVAARLEEEMTDKIEDLEPTKILEIGPTMISQNKKPDEMGENEKPKLQQLVISLDDSGDEGAKNDRSCKINEMKKRKWEEEENVDRKATYVYKSKAEECKMLADLADFPNLAAMLAAEATLRENRKKKNKKRKKKQQKIECEVQNEMVDEAGKEEERAGNDEPQKLIANTSKAVETTIAFKAGDDVRSAMVINLCSSSSERYEVIADLGSSKDLGEIVPIEVIVRKDEKRIEAQDDNVYAAKEKEQPDILEAVETTEASENESVPETQSIVPKKLLVKIVKEEKQADLSKDVETRISLERESVERANNIVLRKLLRGPRYFDHPKSSWGMCFNCGEDDHTAVNCIVQKRKKPCFICGGLEHNAKHCKQRNVCFICGGRAHLGRGCTEIYPSTDGSSKICLRCGDSGHDMFSCSNDYSPDDLKEIQCYVCNAFGHLSCADFMDEGPRQISCYNCGQSGHLGFGCTKRHGDAGGSRSAFLCYECRKEGHFAQECIKYAKVGQEMGDLVTPERFSEEKKDILRSRYAPNESYKAHRRKRQYKRRVNMTEDQSRWNSIHGQSMLCGEARANVW